MPKQIWKIDQFHGGLNSNADPRDVDDNQLSSAVSCMVDEIGVIRTMGGTSEYSNQQYGIVTDNTSPTTAGTINPGYGLFAFKADRTGAGVINADVNGEKSGGSGAAALLVGSATWPVDALIGATLKNTTDNSTTIITDNTATTATGTLSGGTDDDWDNGDDYVITAFPERGDSYLAFSDADSTGKIHVYSYDANSWSTPITGLTSVAGGNRKDVFYSADGVLRTCDAEFGNLNANKWLGYVYSKLYQTLAGAAEHLIDQWVYTDQELKSFDDLSIDLVLDDCSAANPDSTSMGSNQTDRLIIGWWKGEDGGWRGKYFIGVAPVFVGGQEGPISIPSKDAADGDIDGTLSFNGELLNIQVFVCQGNGAGRVDNADHLLGDERIIGIKLYAKAFPSSTWYLLKEIDLIKGGKFGWNDYVDSQAATGHMVGTHGFLGTDNHIFARFASTEFVMDDAGGFQAFEKGTAKCQVDIGTAALGTHTDKHGTSHNREGYLRVSGFYYTPVYGDTSVNLNSASVQNIDITGITLPAEANPATFVFEILDENFNVLHKQQDQAVIAAASGTAPPAGGSSGGGGGGGDDPYEGDSDDTLI